MPRLEVHTHDRRQVFQILDPEFVVGSGDSAELRLRGPYLVESQVRCRLLASGLFVEPDSGVPRLIVNGKPTQGATLTHGDTLAVGTNLLVFCGDDLPAPIVKPSMVPDEAAAESALRAEASASDGLALDIRLPGTERADKVPTKVRGADVDPLSAGAKNAVSPKAGSKKPSAKTVTAPTARAPSAAVRSAGRPVPRRSSGRASGGGSGGNNQIIVWTVLVVGVALVLILAQAFGGGSEPQKDESLLELAQRQWQSGDHDAAFRTLSMAEESSRGDERSRIRALRDGWQYAMSREADQSEIDAARASHRLTTRFKSSFFDAANPKRSAARELLRQTSAWLTEYEFLAERHDDVRLWNGEIRNLRELALQHTSVDDVDTAEDVLYRVDYWMRFTNRRYRLAIETLEGWLRGGSEDEAGARRVRRRLDELQREGPTWLSERRREILQDHASGDAGPAISALRFLVDGGVPTAWLSDERSLLQSYESEFSGR
ncbi:MAG: FHA domain-containing protein [Planctomycetota bacterium]